MGLFIKMEEAFAGTAFYQTYVSKWPPPFNIASFDVCLIMVLILLFVCPVIRDAIADRIRQKRELRWYQEYQRRQAEKDGEDSLPEIYRRTQKRKVRRYRRNEGLRSGEQKIHRDHKKRPGKELEILDEGYFFDEEDTPEELELFEEAEDVTSYAMEDDYKDTPSSAVYEAVYGVDADAGEPVLQDRVSKDYMRSEEEALTEMELADEDAYISPEAKDDFNPAYIRQEDMRESTDIEDQPDIEDQSNSEKLLDTGGQADIEEASDTGEQPEDEFTRLMQKIRRAKEERTAEDHLLREKEESRQRNLDEIDRKLTEKMRAEEPSENRGRTTQDAALEQAKREAASEKRAEMERRRAREEKLREKAEKKTSPARQGNGLPYGRQDGKSTRGRRHG